MSYFPEFTLSFVKKSPFPKLPKNHPKITQNHKTLVNEISREIWRPLKPERGIGRKATLSDVKTAFTFTAALRELMRYRLKLRENEW